MPMYDLSCLCVDTNYDAIGEVFPVRIDSNEFIDTLKNAIRTRKAPVLDFTAADSLEIYQLSPPLFIKRTDALVAEIKNIQVDNKNPGALHNDQQKATAIQLFDPTSLISEYWSAPPKKKAVHVLVSVPPSESGRTPSWLRDWHSQLWNRGSNPFHRTVTLTTSTYRKVVQEMATSDTDDKKSILRRKRALLDALSNEKTDIEMEDSISDMVAVDPCFELENILPYDLEYMDFGKLARCNRVPKLCLVRSEYKVMDDLLNSDELKNSIQFVTGTPGIGKTSYLYLRLVENLVKGVPFLFLDSKGNLFHIQQNSVSTVSVDMVESITAEEILVDFDYPKSTTKTFSQLTESQVRLVIACSPNKIFLESWLKQRLDGGLPDKFVMENWDEAEFWIMSFFLSNINVAPDKLREAVRYFGLNPRVALDATRSDAKFNKWKLWVKAAVGEIRNKDKLQAALNRVISVEHQMIFEVVAGTKNRQYEGSYLKPRSMWVLKEMLLRLDIKTSAQKREFHNLMEGKAQFRGIFGLFWERQVHSYLSNLKEPLTVELRDLDNDSEILQWSIHLDGRHEKFQLGGLEDVLKPYVDNGLSSYFSQCSKTFPTINALFHNVEPPGQDLSPLVLAQITIKYQPLKIDELKKIQQDLGQSLQTLKPSRKKKWAIVFVVPLEKLNHLKRIQALAAKSASEQERWAKKTRQFVLGLSKDQVYN